MNNNDNNRKKYFFYLISTFFLITLLLIFLTGCGYLSIDNISKEKTSSGSSLVETTEIIISGSDRPTNDNTTDITIEGNTIIIGIDETFPPFEFVQDGQTIGFDVDIINEIASRLEKEIIIEPIKWDPEFKIIQEGDLDAIISAVPYNEEKDTIVDFSEPYFTMKYLLISLVGSDITVKEQLEAKKAGILESCDCHIDEGYLDTFEIMEYKDALELLEALRNNEIEAVLISLPIAVNLLRENEGTYFVLEEILSYKEFVIVFPEGSPLKQKFNDALEEIKEDGTYGMIYNEWFDYPS